MRIGVDAGCWANDRGYGRFTRELLSSMVKIARDDEFVFFLDPASRSRFSLADDNVTGIDVKQTVSPSRAAASDGSRSIGDMLRLTRAVWGQSLDVFFSPSVYTYFPLPPRLRAVVGIHDAIADKYPELTLPSRKARLFWRAKVSLAVFQAKLVLSVSEFAADDVSEVLGVSRARIRVAVEAPATVYRPSETPESIELAAARFGLSKDARWFIYVGGFNPHKHVDLLVESFAQSVSGLPEGEKPHLLLVGKRDGDVFHGDWKQISETIEKVGVSELVVWTDFVEDEVLRDLHSGALALVLPSQCEGFGLPAVEAAACGSPVVATTQSPLPQLLKGGGIFVDPGDRSSLTKALRRMIDDPDARARMGRLARTRAQLLSWEKCAEATLAALREAAG